MCFEHCFGLEAGEVAELLGVFGDGGDVVACCGGQEGAIEVDEGSVVGAGGTEVEEFDLGGVSNCGEEGGAMGLG